MFSGNIFIKYVFIFVCIELIDFKVEMVALSHYHAKTKYAIVKVILSILHAFI